MESAITSPPASKPAPRARLGTWILFAVVAAVFCSTLVVLVVLDHYAKRYALQQTDTRLQQLAWQMRDALDRGIHERFVDMRLLATAEAGMDPRKPEALRSLFDDLKETQSHYAWMGKADASGKVLVASGGLLEGADVASAPGSSMRSRADMPATTTLPCCWKTNFRRRPNPGASSISPCRCVMRTAGCAA